MIVLSSCWGLAPTAVVDMNDVAQIAEPTLAGRTNVFMTVDGAAIVWRRLDITAGFCGWWRVWAAAATCRLQKGKR